MRAKFGPGSGVAKSVVAGATVVAALAALPTAGDAAKTRHVPGAGNSLQITTNGPDLRTVAINQDGSVDYCFDQAIQNVPSAAAFTIYTYDASRHFVATDAKVDANNGSCVFAHFSPSADTRAGTIAAITGGAVTDAGGRANLSSTEPLVGSNARPAAGATTAPDLIGASYDNNTNTVAYRFDQTVTNVNANGNGFTATLASGQSIPASSASASGATVTAKFGTNKPARAAVANGAVSSTPADAGAAPLATPGGAGAVGVDGGDTASTPVLQSAKLINGNSQWQLQYSADVTAGNAGAIQAVSDNGTTTQATTISRPSSGTLIVAFNGNAAAEPSAVVRIVDVGGGGNDPSAANTPPTGASGVAVGQFNNLPGYTNSADLLKVGYLPATHQAVYVFDEAAAAVDANSPGGFYYSTAAGSAAGASGVTFNNNAAFVTFSSAADSSIGAGFNTGAVRDASGYTAPGAAESYQVEAGGSGPSTPTPPQGVTPTPAGPTQFTTKIKLRHTGSVSKRQYRGSLSSSGRGCKSNRTLYLKVRGRSKSIKKFHSRSDGTFKLAKRKRPGSRVYVYAPARFSPTYHLTCKTGYSNRSAKG